MTDDAELLRRYATDRSEAAFAELVRRHVDLVYSAALRQMGGDHHRANDVTQMVFVNLARKAASLVRHPVLPAWLYRASHLEAADVRRREGRRQKYEHAAGVEAGIADGNGDALAWGEVRPVLDQAMNDLNERDRQAVLLRFFSNRPFVEIGRQLGLTENAARMRVERALAKLHELLGGRGITSSSAALAAALMAQAVTAAPAGVAATAAGAALAGAGSAAGAWIVFMTSTKLPLALTAALVLGGAGIGVWQEQVARRTDRELADLSRQNRIISALKKENQRLIASAEQARELRDDDASLDALAAQVEQAEIKAADREAAVAKASRLAEPHAKSSRVMTIDNSNPAFEPATEDRAPTKITVVKPQFPAAMLKAGISGQVVVDLVVGADGTVYNAQAVSSTNAGFEDSVVQAISQWTFTPGQKDGQPVNTHLQIPVNFTPTRGSGWF